MLIDFLIKRLVALATNLLIAGVLMAQVQDMPVFNKSVLQQTIPDFRKSFIQSAELSMDPTGFRIRGIKGWAWTVDQYLQEIPTLSKYKMNFLMNCFVSVYSHQKKTANDSWNNEWWWPMSEEIKDGIKAVINKCNEYGIAFCFSMHPQLNTQRPINFKNEKDYADFIQHYYWAQQQGVRWFSICLDDVYTNPAIQVDANEQAAFVNRVLHDLRKVDKKAQMIFCPTWYWGTGENDEQRKYYETLATSLHQDVYVFWTGGATTSVAITLPEATAFRNLIQHRIILWDNYPANDTKPTLHLQPVSLRDRALHTVIEGYMSIPMSSQNQINRIPLFTAADYAFSPQNYDPNHSLLEAIAHQSDDKQLQQTLQDIVKLYATDTITNQTGFNALIAGFEQILKEGSQAQAQEYIKNAEETLFSLTQKAPLCYKDTKNTLQENIIALKAQYKAAYKTELP